MQTFHFTSTLEKLHFKIVLNKRQYLIVVLLLHYANPLFSSNKPSEITITKNALDTDFTYFDLNNSENEKRNNQFATLKSFENNFLIEKQPLLVIPSSSNKNFLDHKISLGITFLSVFGVLSTMLLYQHQLKKKILLTRSQVEKKQDEFSILSEKHELQLEQSLQEGKDKERQRLGRELHDGIAGNIASIKHHLSIIMESNTDERLISVMDNLDNTYNEIRDISHNLSNSKLSENTFTNLLQSYLEKTVENHAIKLNLYLFPEEKLNLLSENIKNELYRIIQELINNVIKHSKAGEVDVQLILGDKYLNLMIEDNGIGFNTNITANGIGLNNIRSRVKELKGTCTIESVLHEWSIINIEIPLT